MRRCAPERCHVAVVLIDAIEGITDQDAKIIGLTHDKGRARDPRQQVGRDRERS